MKKIMLAIGVIALGFVACTDENTFGEGLQPEKDKLGLSMVDTIAVKSFTYVPDSLPISNTNDFLLGGLWDENSGLVSAGLAAQMRYASLGYYADSVHRRDDIVVDSAFIFLSYFDIWGDSNAINEIEIYELNSELSNTFEYTTQFNIEEYYDASGYIGTKRFKVADMENAYSKFYVDGDSVQAYALRIPLPLALQERILGSIDDLNATGNSTAGSDLFKEVFKGIYVKHTFGTGALVNIETSAGLLRMQFDYHDPLEDYVSDTLASVEGLDSFVYTSISRNISFYTNNECARVAVVEKDLAGSAIKSKISSQDVDFTCVRGGGALRTKLVFPDFTMHPDFLPLPGEDSARILINSAMLTFYVNQEYTDINDGYHTGELIAYLNVEEPYFVVETSDNKAHYSASFNSVTNSYTFDLTSYIQARVSKPDDTKVYDLVLGLRNEIVSPTQTFLNTVNSEENPTKLEVIYTRY